MTCQILQRWNCDTERLETVASSSIRRYASYKQVHSCRTNMITVFAFLFYVVSVLIGLFSGLLQPAASSLKSRTDSALKLATFMLETGLLICFTGWIFEADWSIVWFIPAGFGGSLVGSLLSYFMLPNKR